MASLIMMNLRVAAFGKLKRLWKTYAALALIGLVVTLSLAALVEMVYHRQLAFGTGAEVQFLGLGFDTMSPGVWLVVGAVAALSLGVLEFVRRRFVMQWGGIQEEIEIEIKRREAH